MVQREKRLFFLFISRTDVHAISAKYNMEVCHYDNPDRPIREMNRGLSYRIMVTKAVKLSYSDISQKVTVRLTPGTILKIGVINMLDFRAGGVTSPNYGTRQYICHRHGTGSLLALHLH